MDQKFNGLENEMAKGNDKATPLQKKGNNMAGGWLFCKKKFFSIVEWLLFSTEAMIFFVKEIKKAVRKNQILKRVIYY